MKKKVLYLLAALFLCQLIAIAEGPNHELEVCDDEIKENGGGGDSYTCSSGGPGSSSCTVSANIGIGDGSGGTSCSVTCNSGYYACCNAYYNKCQCRKEK